MINLCTIVDNVQLSTHLAIIQERWEDISAIPAYKVVCPLFSLKTIKQFILSCHSLTFSATSAAGNSLAPVGSGRLCQNAFL